MVRCNISIPPDYDVEKSVVLTSRTGSNSFADGDATYDGVCEVCHTNTKYHRNNPSGDHTHYAGEDCISCHNHVPDEFAHGGGAGTGCESCHGHDAGYGGATGGAGRYESHSTHTENDADDVMGPNMACSGCHDTDNFPLFVDGKDLTTTAACDTCHSPGGSYDGVSDLLFGAKANWENGVYDGSLLAVGKEKWCTGCHDEDPSVIQGVSAPNVVGDENASEPQGYYYGTGYGYYKTGHGLPPSQYYPYSGNTLSGAGLECGDCHDFTKPHIDGLARTYADPGTPSSYQDGYRLQSVGVEYPLEVPRGNYCPWEPEYATQELVETDEFRLCFTCHNSEPFVNECSTNTNFRSDDTPINAHWYHLSRLQDCGEGPLWQSDWDDSHGPDTRATCMSCHNVHGSTQLAMVRDGRLVDRAPGIQVRYYNDTMSYVCGGPSPYDPTPENVQLPDSTGTVWNANTENMCVDCHGGCGWNVVYMRTPVDIMSPEIQGVYGVVGSDNLSVKFSEGVYSDTGALGDLTTSDLSLTDTDNFRYLAGISHTTGDDVALLTLSEAVDFTEDIGVDTLQAATGSSIYDVADNAMVAISVTIQEDATPPSISGQNPANNDTDVFTDSNITFTLADSEAGMDWTTFSIQLSGDKGYSQTYTVYDISVVSKTGTLSSYDVTVDPDTDFGNEEVITVTVDVDDRLGNAMTPALWSFTTVGGGAVQYMTLHPSGLNNQYQSWSITSSWATDLDSNDGDARRATRCCTGGPTMYYFWVDMDDFGLPGATIQSMTISVYARYRIQGGGDTPAVGPVDIGYKTGSYSKWKGTTDTNNSLDYTLIQFTATTDSDNGALDPTDLDNLQIGVKKSIHSNLELRVTEVAVEVEYLPL